MTKKKTTKKYEPKEFSFVIETTDFERQVIEDIQTEAEEAAALLENGELVLEKCEDDDILDHIWYDDGIINYRLLAEKTYEAIQDCKDNDPNPHTGKIEVLVEI